MSIDYTDAPLPELLMRQAERIADLEAQVERWDRATAAVEYGLAKDVGRGNYALPCATFQGALSAIARYGACGMQGEAMGKLLTSYERWVRS